MKVKKFIATTAMALVGLMTFSSCWLLVDKEKAVERISAVQPEKQVDRTVVTKDNILIDIDGVRKEVDFRSEAEKYYTLNGETTRGRFQCYGDWLYYVYNYSVRRDTMKFALMRANIYTGATENICDFGETYCGEFYLGVFSCEIYGDRYFFFCAQGVLKIFDMETNQFTYEHQLDTEDEIKETMKTSNFYNYSFTRNESSADYVKDGMYYRYMHDGTYRELKGVPEWMVAEEGTISGLSLYKIEDYIYTLSYKDIEEERKAYDLAEGVEVDYMTVVKPLKDAEQGTVQIDYKENVFVYEHEGSILVQKEDTSYKIESDYTNYKIGSGTITRYELDEEGRSIEETAFTIDGAYLKEHNEALQQLSKLWNKTKEGGLTCGKVCSAGGRVFFECHNYYGTWIAGSSSAYYLCELDPITFKVEYLGYYLSRLDAIYVH